MEVLIDSQKPLNAALHFIQPSCTASEGDTSVGDTVCQMSEVDMAVVKPEVCAVIYLIFLCNHVFPMA